MIITRTPFRFTLGGGGTDLPAYYEKRGGFILAAGIDKYLYINVNRPIVDDLIRIKYALSETVERRDQVRHDIAREAMAMMGIENALEIVSMADVPAGTGLGSSSCYAVGLLHALSRLKREYVPLQTLAERACELEIGRLAKPIGKQDQYMAAFGGIRVLEIAPDGTVSLRNARVDGATLEDFNRNLLAFYTRTSRSADKILRTQGRAARAGRCDVVGNLDRIKEIGLGVLEALERGDLRRIGLLFDEHWTRKKRLAPGISNAWFDRIYAAAKANGASGGKISGAGGGGFFLFYCERGHKRLRAAMAGLGLREMRYRFEFEGTKLIADLGGGTR
ncbi:MAG: galactokinase [Candidatus Aminicenantes bacterium]|nr:galactokinase [Candidatus Aminicenantes bacterium]